MLLEPGTRNAMVDAANALLNGGSIEIQDAGDVVLVAIALHSTAYLASVSGSATMIGGDNTTAISAGNPRTGTGAATGTATKYRFKNSGGTVLRSGTIAGGELTLDNTSIASGQTVNLTGGTFTQPAGS